MIKHLEVKTYEYYGISVVVKTDYNNGKISLVENGSNLLTPDKKWIFSGRSLEFMDSWLQILDAMKYAIEEASKELEAYQKQKAKDKEDEVCKVLMIASDLVEKEKNKVLKKKKI